MSTQADEKAKITATVINTLAVAIIVQDASHRVTRHASVQPIYAAIAGTSPLWVSFNLSFSVSVETRHRAALVPYPGSFSAKIFKRLL